MTDKRTSALLVGHLSKREQCDSKHKFEKAGRHLQRLEAADTNGRKVPDPRVHADVQHIASKPKIAVR